MSEKKPPKFASILTSAKNHKKAILVFSLAAAFILLLILLLIVFQNNALREQPSGTVQDGLSTAVTDSGTPGIPETPAETSESPSDKSVPEESATEEPVTEETNPSEPVTSESVTSESVTEEPAVSEPVSEEPVASEPATEEPTTEEPAVSEPVTEEPSVEQSAADSSVSVEIGASQTTGYAPLDTLTNKILSGIISRGMSPEAKLKAIYGYVRNHMTYNMFPPTAEGIYDEVISLGYSDYDGSQITLAYQAATYRQGVCDHYAALTMILARAAGISLFQSGGLSYNGSSHAWNILMVNGEKYLVDTNYGIFLQRFSDSGFTEQMDGRNFFNHFNTAVPPIEEKKISWMFNAGFGNQRFVGNSRGEITQKASVNRPLYSSPGDLYPNPITPMVTAEGENNTFTATVSSGGVILETMKEQSGDNTMYYFSWYPPAQGTYVVEITVTSDDIFTGHFTIDAVITD